LLAGFANDIWKVTPNLTLNLGVRYEYLTVPLSENTQDLNASASVPGLITFHSPTTQKYNFMPRIGIAYSPGTSGKTSIRAGFGITRDVLYDNLGTLSLPPQLSTTVENTNLGGTCSGRRGGGSGHLGLHSGSVAAGSLQLEFRNSARVRRWPGVREPVCRNARDLSSRAA
jgi:hypothetical protein